MRVVVDASFCGAWFLPDEQSSTAESILIDAISGTLTLHAPVLWSYEIINLLVSAVRRGRMSASSIEEAMDLMKSLPIKTFDGADAHVRERIFRLATTHQLSAYDAAYLELADQYKCPLLTTDAKLQTAAAVIKLPTI